MYLRWGRMAKTHSRSSQNPRYWESRIWRKRLGLWRSRGRFAKDAWKLSDMTGMSTIQKPLSRKSSLDGVTGDNGAMAVVISNPSRIKQAEDQRWQLRRVSVIRYAFA